MKARAAIFREIGTALTIEEIEVDEVVAEALGINTTLENLIALPGSRVINYEPSLMLALDESCRLQCRLSLETRTKAYQVRTGDFPPGARFLQKPFTLGALVGRVREVLES